MKKLNTGWISINREIKNHWVFQKPEMLKAWIYLLVEVNFSDSKVTIGNDLLTVKRGQIVTTLRSLSSGFGMGLKASTNVLILFEKDEMITREIVGKGKQSRTLININNFDAYQVFSETLRKRKGNTNETLTQHEGNANGIQNNKETRKQGNKETRKQV